MNNSKKYSKKRKIDLAVEKCNETHDFNLPPPKQLTNQIMLRLNDISNEKQFSPCSVITLSGNKGNAYNESTRPMNSGNSSNIDISNDNQHQCTPKIDLTNYQLSPPKRIISVIKQLEDTSRKSRKSTNSCDSLIGKVKVRCLETMIDESKSAKFVELKASFPLVKSKNINYKSKEVIPSNPQLNSSAKVVTESSLIEIKNLFLKYFSKQVQDNIVIIASILSIISLVHKIFKEQMDMELNNKNKYQQPGGKNISNTIYLKHVNALETKLKEKLKDIVNTFTDYEFEHAFLMVFASLLRVYIILEPSSKPTIFQIVSKLLLCSLRKDKSIHPKVYKLLQFKFFRYNCSRFFGVIEWGQKKYPNYRDSIPLFFTTSLHCKKYFKKVLDVVSNGSPKDLRPLIDSAVLTYCSCSTLKEPNSYSSTALEKCNHKMTPQISIQNSVNRLCAVENLVLSNTPVKPFQGMSVSSGNEVQNTTTSVIVEPTEAYSPLSTHNENHPSSLMSVSYEPKTSEVITPLMYSTVDEILEEALELTMIKPKTDHDILPLQNDCITTIPKPVDNTMFIKTEPHQLIPIQMYQEMSHLLINADDPHQNEINDTYKVSTVDEILGEALELTMIKPKTDLDILPLQNDCITTIQKREDNTVFIKTESNQLIPTRMYKDGARLLINADDPDLDEIRDTYKCYFENCKKIPKVICTYCYLAKYCSYNCQRLHWSASHINECEAFSKCSSTRV